jgi:hypothetical protein
MPSFLFLLYKLICPLLLPPIYSSVRYSLTTDTGDKQTGAYNTSMPTYDSHQYWHKLAIIAHCNKEECTPWGSGEEVSKNIDLGKVGLHFGLDAVRGQGQSYD